MISTEKTNDLLNAEARDVEAREARAGDATARRVGIIGMPLSFGANVAGVDLGPAAVRIARLNQRVAQLGYEVRDLGDVRFERPITSLAPVTHTRSNEVQELAIYLREVAAACESLARDVRQSLDAGEVPVVIGGDHAIAIGTGSGVSSYFRGKQQSVGLIWVDAHADMNTPETTPSGNIHGMPLAALLGYGDPALVELCDFAPKFDPALCVHIGARDVDPGERELIRRTGLRCFTMREIDERGMNSVIDDALKIVGQASGGYYVTFDVDALDPVDAPGSGTVVRGGLTYREAHLAMEKIAEAGGMRALEIVEINTALDVNNKTAELGVELILSALGKTIL